MAYDEDLMQRLHNAIDGRAVTTEMRMMGGACLFVNGNMLCGAHRAKDGTRAIMLRVGKERHAQALARPHVSPMRQGSRNMGGFCQIDPAISGEELFSLTNLALEFVQSLPPKA